jgi:DNA repair exonuclease SbcCD ATPase subunit
MKIKKVEWRNFTSYGNKKQEIVFPEEACLFQVIGGNGFGKTSISQVITFGLYGKVEGKKLGDIPNRVNGNAWVRIHLDNGHNDIVIERGLEPQLFELYVDGMKYDQAGKKNVQEYLTDDLIGIPFYVFNNTLLLSINDFKSFIKMSTQDKRAIVDKIFGFHILNQMRDLLKDESRRIKEESDITFGKIQSIQNSILKSTKELDLLTEQIVEESRDRLNSLEENLVKFSKLEEIHSSKILEFNEVESDLKKNIFSVNNLLAESRAKHKELLRKVSLYDHEKCPTCESDLSGVFHIELKNNLQKETLDLDAKIKDLETQYFDLKNKEAEFSKSKSELREKGMKITSAIKELQKEIESLKSPKNNDKQLESLKRIVSDLEKDNENLNVQNFKNEEKNTWIRTLDDILGEKGVKQLAVKTILPSLNSEILDLMGQMHLDYQVVFDEEFKATIYHMGIEIPSSTLSTGEMKKVDFVVLVAIMKLMKMKFSSINLLFLDELFSSVDPDGIHSILKILQRITRELGLNIFVINHAPMPHEIFDWKLEVSKTNNFSSITIERF